MTKTIIKNVYPVDDYVYELKFKTYSKFYQNVHDAFKEKYRNPERSMIIRHPLNFTSHYYQELEGKSLALGDEPMNGGYLVDKFSDDIKPKYSKLKQILSDCFRVAFVGMFLVLLVIYINEVFNS